MDSDTFAPEGGGKPLPPCPICNAPVERAKVQNTWPFCSPRCQQIDLGRWLGESYVISSDAVSQRELGTAQRLAALSRSGGSSNKP